MSMPHQNTNCFDIQIPFESEMNRSITVFRTFFPAQFLFSFLIFQFAHLKINFSQNFGFKIVSMFNRSLPLSACTFQCMFLFFVERNSLFFSFHVEFIPVLKLFASMSAIPFFVVYSGYRRYLLSVFSQMFSRVGFKLDGFFLNSDAK